MKLFKAHCITIRNPFHPRLNRDIAELTRSAPIGALAPKTKQPFVILRNGQAVLRANWDQPVSDGDVMSVVLLPQGGDNNGGSNVLKVVLLIVVAVVAWYVGAPVASGGLGYGGLAQAAVSMEGNPVIDASFKISPRSNNEPN